MTELAKGQALGHSQSAVRNPQSVIGTARRKVDATAKVTGETKFADDLSLPRMLWCKLLRSREPHARIVRIDTSRAERHPGVVAVLTGRDLPIPFGILPISQDEHALCPDHVRFVGDPVAAVARGPLHVGPRVQPGEGLIDIAALGKPGWLHVVEIAH